MQLLHKIRIFCIPSHHNNHQPRGLHEHSLLFYALIITVAKLALFVSVALYPSIALSSQITQSTLLSMTNSSRAASGLPALDYNATLERAATRKANDMMANQYFAHTSPSGITPWYWIQNEGYDYEVAGENLAIDFTEAEDVHQAWMASATHRANILSPEYTEIGIGVAKGIYDGLDTIIAVQMFGAPASITSTPEPDLTPVPTPSTTPTITTASPATVTTPKINSSPTLTPTPTTQPVTPTPLTTPTLEAPSIVSAESKVIQVFGTSQPDTLIQILFNGNVLAENIQVQENSTYSTSLDIHNQNEGTYEVIARASLGDQSADSEPITISIDKTAPTIALQTDCDAVTTNTTQIVLHTSEDTAPTLNMEPQIEYSISPTRDHEYMIRFNTAPPENIRMTATTKDIAGNSTTKTFDISNLDKNNHCDNDSLIAGITFNDAQGIVQRTIGFIGIAVLLLLIMNIVIKARVQHPTMIVNSVSFIVFAFILFIF